MNTPIVLPDFQDVAAKDGGGQPLTALERFIYDHEPAGVADADAFRSQLLAVLAERRPEATASMLANAILGALHIPDYEGLVLASGTPVRQMYFERIEAMLERAALLPDTEQVSVLRQRLDHIHSIMSEKDKNGEDLEIGSTSFKSVRRWSDWRNDK